MKYEKMTDELLIEKLRGGEKEIIDFLMEKYKNLVRKEANAMYLLGGETDDLIQEGMIGLFKAVRMTMSLLVMAGSSINCRKRL